MPVPGTPYSRVYYISGLQYDIPPRTSGCWSMHASSVAFDNCFFVYAAGSKVYCRVGKAFFSGEVGSGVHPTPPSRDSFK